MIMELKDTVDMMNSTDYKARFKAEFNQIVIRINGLADMLIKMDNNTLEFTPKCSKELLETQLVTMKAYAELLEVRAEVERIKLYD